MHRLTPRERDVVQRLIAGRTNKEIARDLAISPHTVRDHVSALLDRFGVDNRAALAAVAMAFLVFGTAGIGPAQHRGRIEAATPRATMPRGEQAGSAQVLTVEDPLHP